MSGLPIFERQDGAATYSKILWNRPVSRTGAGRFLLPGGYRQDFSVLTTTHQTLMAAGAGECTVVLPDVLVPLLGGASSTTFAASSPSGSLGREALGRLLQLSEDNDTVMLGANLSGNSDTTLLIERFLSEYAGRVVAFGDALVNLQHRLQAFTDRPDTLMVMTMPEVFKLAGVLSVPITIRRDGGLINKLEIIRDVAAVSQAELVVYGSEIIVACDGRLGVTPVPYRLAEFPALFYGVTGVFWTQNATSRYEGLMTAAHVMQQVGGPLTADPKRRVTLSEAAKAVQTYLSDAF